MKKAKTKGIKYKLQGGLVEKTLHVSSGSEMVGFPYKPFDILACYENIWC